MERFHLKKINDRVKAQYQIKISNKFADLWNLPDNVEIIRAWESIRENIKASSRDSLGYYESKRH
jgi:hypothetical protein